MRATVGLLRGRGGRAAGVRGGRGAQAAGEEAAHERGGWGGAHQAAAGCGHRARVRLAGTAPHRALSGGSPFPGFCLQISKQPGGRSCLLGPPTARRRVRRAQCPCYCKDLQHGTTCHQPTRSRQPDAGGQTVPDRFLGAEPRTPGLLPAHMRECFAHDSGRGQVRSTPRGSTLPCGHQRLAFPHRGALTSPQLQLLTPQTGVPGSR